MPADHVDDDIALGDRTEAAIKTRGLLGAKILEVMSRGDGRQEGTIPRDRTMLLYSSCSTLSVNSRRRSAA